MILAAAFLERPANGITVPQGGSAYKAMDQLLVGRILAGCSNRSAPGEDRMGAEIVKLLWEWDPERVTNLARLCVQVGTHPESWKTAKGSSYRNQGSLTTVRCGPIGSSPCSTHWASLSRRQRPTSSQTSWSAGEGQYGCRRRRSCVDAVAVLISDPQQAWSQKHSRARC